MSCVFLVISLPRDTDTESVWNTLNTSLPHLLVQLRIETDIDGTLSSHCQPSSPHLLPKFEPPSWFRFERTMDLVANALISLMALGARFLNVTPCICTQISSCISSHIYIPRIDVLSCGDGWCTRAQRHQRWQIGFACPQASFRRLWTTFLADVRGRFVDSI